MTPRIIIVPEGYFRLCDATGRVLEARDPTPEAEGRAITDEGVIYATAAHLADPRSHLTPPPVRDAWVLRTVNGFEMSPPAPGGIQPDKISTAVLSIEDEHGTTIWQRKAS